MLTYAARYHIHHSHRNPNRANTILDKLPAETLSLILDKLSNDTPSINAARRVCREFEKAAWPAFATSFNHRIFHPTVDSGA